MSSWDAVTRGLYKHHWAMPRPLLCMLPVYLLEATTYALRHIDELR
jgi:hypothetical protein